MPPGSRQHVHNKYNMNNQEAPKQQPIRDSECINFTDYSLQIKQTTSHMDLQNYQDQSIVLQREPLIYHLPPIVSATSTAQQSVLQPAVEDTNNFSTTPEHFTVSRVCRVNTAHDYSSTKSDNFLIKEIYYQPVEIALPTAVEVEKPAPNSEEMVMPCTLVETTHNHPSPQQLQPKDETTKQLSRSKIESDQKAKIMTEVLLQKISQLETTVKNLEEEKKKNQELIKAVEYQSTPHTLAYGSIKKNNQALKRFSTVNETQQTFNQNNQFRVRSLASKNVSSEYKIHSNIYSMTLTEGKADSTIKDELELLKKKLQALENSQKFTDQSVRNTIREHNYKIFDSKPEEKLCTPNRNELRGKIVKRTGSKLHSPENTFRTQTEESIEADADKGFIRSGPQKTKEMDNSMYSNIVENEDQEVRKRADSSAIFRKNPGPAIVQKRALDLENFTKSNTLQFYPEQQKILIQSRETESMIAKMDSLSPVMSSYSQIYIPDLNPSPHHHNTSEELIEIGKLTFKKLGCEITESTILNVKKFKNCVLFNIGTQSSVLWHYEGRFYFGGWKTHANGEGEKHGKGIEYVPNKYKYKGNFEDGKRSGYGIMIEENGSVYTGQWYEGLKQGKGRYLESDGSQYDGDWKLGKKSGNGRLIFKGKLQFEGHFVSGLKTGFGKQYFENGDYYEGDYFQNKFHGRGSYFWASKALYTGDFKEGKRHGHGVWRSGQKNYDTYEGEYAEDNKNGYGVYKWANGAVYKGSFKDDLKHGEGSITYENGKTVHMIWNKGNVEKTLTSSQYFEQSSRAHNPASTSLTSGPKTKLKKGSSNARSNQNLQSAKSLKSERSLPKGVSIRKDLHGQSSPKSSPKVQFRTKFNNTDLLKAKISMESRQGSSNGNIKDPPYRGMQTSSNINMNV